MCACIMECLEPMEGCILDKGAKLGRVKIGANETFGIQKPRNQRTNYQVPGTRYLVPGTYSSKYLVQLYLEAFFCIMTS